MSARGTIAAALTILASAAAFTAASLLPWSHLVSAAYLGRFSLFALALGFLAAGVAMLLRSLGVGRPAAAAALGSLFVFPAAWALNGNEPVSVVLLHLDSLRAASTSAYGYTRPTTPRMEALARDGALVFERFFAQSAGTDKSTPAMLASIYPSMFYDPWSDEHNFLVPDRFPFLGEVLRPHGFASYAFSSNPQVSSARNYARGFDRFEELWLDEPRAHGLLERLEGRMEEIPEPLFAFGLVLDPHSPYTPAEGFDLFSEPGAPSAREVVELVKAGEDPARFVATMIALYDGEIREVDDALGALVDRLEDAGRLERTMLIVTSDHGEKFLDGAEIGHGGTLLEEVIHVPMIWSFPSPLRHPPLRPHARSVGLLASHVDIAPTVLGYLGLEAPETFQGRNLVPFLYGKAEAPRERALIEELADGFAHRALRGERWKLFQREKPDGEKAHQLVDTDRSPERRLGADDPDVDPRILAEMIAELERRVARLRAFYLPKAAEPPPDEETLRRIRDLGYAR